MQVSVETLEGLERRMTISVPSEEVEQRISARVDELSKKIKIDGFRPGKVPQRVVRQRFGRSVRNEVVEELIKSSLTDAFLQQDIEPAGQPKLEDTDFKDGGPLEFNVKFEVYPEIELNIPADWSFEKPAATVEDADIDKVIDDLREQHKNWQVVDRAAQDGDKVTIAFEGTIDGEPFEGGKGAGVELVLGSGRMIAGFEEGLLGAKPGSDVVLDLTFPEEYHNKDVAGKPVQFKVSIGNVNEGILPEVDDADFLKALGVREGGVDTLRSELRKTMERELQVKIDGDFRRVVLEALVEANPIDPPKGLVDTEVMNLQMQFLQQLRMEPNIELLQNMPKDNFITDAERRVKYGLLLSEVIKQFDIQLDQERLQESIAKEAAAYDDPEQVKAWYENNRQNMANLEYLVMEQMTVEKLVEKATVTEKSMSYFDIMKPE